MKIKLSLVPYHVVNLENIRYIVLSILTAFFLWPNILTALSFFLFLVVVQFSNLNFTVINHKFTTIIEPIPNKSYKLVTTHQTTLSCLFHAFYSCDWLWIIYIFSIIPCNHISLHIFTTPLHTHITSISHFFPFL